MPKRLRGLASGRNVLIALLVLVLASIAMNIAATAFYRATGGYGILDLGGGANLFDDRGGYTPAQAYALISHYGRAGLHRYYLLLVADTFFPPTVGLFGLLAICWALGRGMPLRRGWYALALLPVLYTLADWSENLGILAMLNAYPHHLVVVAKWTDAARAAKSGLAQTTLLIVLATWAAAVLWKRKCGRVQTHGAMD